MPSAVPFDPVHSAVLCMDYQAGIVSIYAKGQQDELLARAANVLGRARRAGATVIYVHVGFRPGLPEIGSRNPLFAAIKASPEHQQLFLGPAGAIHPAVAPADGDIVVTKHRVSAFFGTDLEMILRAKEIDTLVLFGIATSGVVLSTLREAADMDYRLVVIRDCCADLDEEVHSCLVEKVFARQATVVSAAEFCDSLDPNT